jgi:hypothetical protein
MKQLIYELESLVLHKLRMVAVTDVELSSHRLILIDGKLKQKTRSWRAQNVEGYYFHDHPYPSRPDNNKRT